jgi:YVTN family beta-propeller protein
MARMPRLAAAALLRSATLAASAALVAGCSRGCAAPSPPLLYTSDEVGGAVFVIDPARAAVVARIPVGKRPRGLKLSPDGTRLYVALSGSPISGPGIDEAHLPPPDHSADGVAVVDVAKRALVATLASGPDPEALDLSPDGRTLFLSNEDTAQMSAIDLPSGKVRGVVDVGKEPEGVTVRPDGKVVFVTSEQEGEVTAVDTATLAVVGHIPTGPRPRSLVLTRDGLTGFVADEFGKRVTVIDAVGFTAQGDIPITLSSPTFSGPRPMGTALSPDGKQVYVTTGRGGSLAILDVATRKQVRSLDGVGDRPWGVATSADGAFAYTANGKSHDVSIINLATGNVDRRVKVDGLPWGIVISR